MARRRYVGGGLMMSRIPDDIIEYIRKVYPLNKYYETVDYLPSGLQYHYQEIISKIINEINICCSVDIYAKWDLLFESAVLLEIHYPKWNFNSDVTIEEKIKTGIEIIYSKYITMSKIGPYAISQDWDTSYLDVNEKIQFQKGIVPLPKVCSSIDEKIKHILMDNNIKIIPTDVINIQVPGMKGKSKGGKAPTVYNCLFDNTW